MDEVRFVARCLAFAALLLVISQLKTNGVSIENHVQASLVNSDVADFVNKAAKGGVKLIHTTADSVKNYIDGRKKTSSQKEVVVVEDDDSVEQ